TYSWWDPLSPEQKDAALDHGLECIANNSNLLKLQEHGGNNADYHDLVTSIARSSAPHAEDIFIRYASKVTDADPPDMLREHFARAKTLRAGGITVGTFIKWAQQYGANFEPWYETCSADQNAEAHTTAAGGLGEWDAGD